MNAVIPAFRILSPARETARPAAVAPAQRIHKLSAGQVISLPLPRGGRIECFSGCLWLTAGDGSGDILLEEGESRTFERSSNVLAESLEHTARFQITPLVI